MKNRVPLLLSLNGGYVDTAGFLALHGLFTTHVTGNFVTFGASLAHGTSGAVTKLLALPVFCIIVVLTQMLDASLTKRGYSAFRLMLGMKVALLALGAVLAIYLGPFPDGDAWPILLTGMVLVSAMAIQNAMHRIHLAAAPPSTVMTLTTTQIMLDVALFLQPTPPEARAAARTRMSRMIPSVTAFAIGCALAALLYVLGGMWFFVLPPLIALVPIWLGEAA